MNFSTLENWTKRDKALEPLAVMACGLEAQRLAHRLLDRSDEELVRLRGAASASVLLIAGASETLPWAPEAVYLGREASAPALLWPIHLTPPFQPELMERALLRQFHNSAAPLVLLPQWQMVLPLGEALPISREFVTRFLVKGAS